MYAGKWVNVFFTHLFSLARVCFFTLIKILEAYGIELEEQ